MNNGFSLFSQVADARLEKSRFSQHSGGGGGEGGEGRIAAGGSGNYIYQIIGIVGCRKYCDPRILA